MREKRYLITILFYKMSDLVSKVGWLYITEREKAREESLEVGSFRYSTGLQTQRLLQTAKIHM